MKFPLENAFLINFYILSQKGPVQGLFSKQTCFRSQLSPWTLSEPKICTVDPDIYQNSPSTEQNAKKLMKTPWNVSELLQTCAEIWKLIKQTLNSTRIEPKYCNFAKKKSLNCTRNIPELEIWSRNVVPTTSLHMIRNFNKFFKLLRWYQFHFGYKHETRYASKNPVNFSNSFHTNWNITKSYLY